MIIHTSRFGQVALNEEDVLVFNDGLLGFADLRRFVLLDDPNDEIFAWLQSCEAPQIAFPVLEPELFHPQFQVHLTKGDLEALKVDAGVRCRAFCIVTIPEDPTQMTANLKAPLFINVEKRWARQCVLQDNNLAIREPIFSKLQQRVVSHPDVSIKKQSNSLDVAVKLGATNLIKTLENP